MSTKNLFLLSLVFIAINSACGQISYDEKLESLYKNTVPLISEEDFMKNLESAENLYILDTRTEKEFAVSHIKGAQFVDYDSFSKDDIRSIPVDASVVVYCSVGYRSERIGEKLLEMGYTNVKNLYGGIFQWKNTDHEVVNALDLPTDSVHTYNKRWSKWLEKGVKVYD